MKTPLETARRWLAQAEHALAVGQILFERELWSDVCFQSEQAAQLALKAFLYGIGRRFVQIHSVRELAAECSKENPGFSGAAENCGFLDRYYLTTRYPDVLPPPALPFESFTKGEARQALDQAIEIVELVKTQVPSGPDE